jgi:hypothetical protein
VAVTLFFEGAAFGAHPIGPTGGIAPLLVGLIAAGTLERRPQPALPARRSEDPFAFLPRRTVTDVLAMAALEERHPVPYLVLLEADYGALHSISLIPGRRSGSTPAQADHPPLSS